MSRILLGVSGGIAAYKALELVRLATAAGHAVRVVQTPASRRFVGAASFAALSGAPALVSEFEHDPAHGAFPDQPPPEHEPLSHLALVANADVYLIAPASANTIAKLAAGLADNLLTSCALAAGCPLLLAPAMNDRMYEHPATQANLRTLEQRGAIVSRRMSDAWRPRARRASGAWPSPPACSPPARTRSPAAPCGASDTAATALRDCRSWSAPGARASRSTACASSATAPRAGWASRSPRPLASAGPR